MLGSPEGDSFKKKPIPAQETKSDEDVELLRSRLIKDSVARLKPLILQDPISHYKDPKYYREIFWFLYRPLSKDLKKKTL